MNGINSIFNEKATSRQNQRDITSSIVRQLSKADIKEIVQGTMKLIEKQLDGDTIYEKVKVDDKDEQEALRGVYLSDPKIIESIMVKMLNSELKKGEVKDKTIKRGVVGMANKVEPFRKSITDENLKSKRDSQEKFTTSDYDKIVKEAKKLEGQNVKNLKENDPRRMNYEKLNDTLNNITSIENSLNKSKIKGVNASMSDEEIIKDMEAKIKTLEEKIKNETPQQQMLRELSVQYSQGDEKIITKEDYETALQETSKSSNPKDEEMKKRALEILGAKGKKISSENPERELSDVEQELSELGDVSWIKTGKYNKAKGRLQSAENDAKDIDEKTLKERRATYEKESSKNKSTLRSLKDVDVEDGFYEESLKNTESDLEKLSALEKEKTELSKEISKLPDVNIEDIGKVQKELQQKTDLLEGKDKEITEARKTASQKMLNEREATDKEKIALEEKLKQKIALLEKQENKITETRRTAGSAPREMLNEKAIINKEKTDLEKKLKQKIALLEKQDNDIKKNKETAPQEMVQEKTKIEEEKKVLENKLKQMQEKKGISDKLENVNKSISQYNKEELLKDKKTANEEIKRIADKKQAQKERESLNKEKTTLEQKEALIRKKDNAQNTVNNLEIMKEKAENKIKLERRRQQLKEDVKNQKLQQKITQEDISRIGSQTKEISKYESVKGLATDRKKHREKYVELAEAGTADAIVTADAERVENIQNLSGKRKKLSEFQGTQLNAGTAINKAVESFGMYMLKFRMFQRGIEDIGKAIKYLQQMEDTSFELGIVSQMGLERIRSMRHELLLTATNYRQSAEEIGKAQLGIVKTGVSLKDSMEIVSASLELSKATYSDLASASESINKILLPLELTGASAENVSKWLYNISITTPASLNSLDQALRQTSAVFGTFLEDITMTGQGLESYKENLAETQLTLLGLIHTQGKTGSVALYKFL